MPQQRQIIIYSTKTCAFCDQVARLCERYGKKYRRVYVDSNLSLRQKLADITGHATVPVTTDGETYVVGWQPTKLMELIRGPA